MALAFGVGALLAVQSGMNTQLSRATQGPLAAAAVSFGIGTVLLLGITAGAGALPALGRAPSVDAGHLVGGLLGAVYLAASLAVFPRLGAALSVGLIITGQMAASVLLDAVGGLGVPARPLGALRVVGLLVVLAGVVALVRGSGAAGSARADARWLALGLVAGAVLPIQGAVNAALRADLDAPLAAASVSFVVGTLVLAGSAAGLLASGRTAPPRARDFGLLPWWAWLGGLLGAAYVLSVLVLIPELGAAVTIGLAVAGQQLASLVIDRYGLVRLPRRAASALRVAGALALLVGVLLVQVGGS